MRRLGLLAITVLLFAACHHKDKPQEVDSTPVAATKAVVDTFVVPSDTVSRQAPRKSVGLQQDSSEITNLRLFTRKKQHVIYSPSLLVGEWLKGTMHMEYRSDGTGLKWNTVDDLTREDAQHFLWSLDSNLLSMDFHLEHGGVVPKYYVVTYVDEESLAYKNVYDDAYLWDKVVEKEE